MLGEMEMQGPGEYQRLHDATVAPSLTELGIERTQSHRWQAIASIPEPDFEQHGTFEDYCRERWGWSRNYANKTIAAAEVASMMGTTVPIPNEAQARELVPLLDRPDKMAEAWTAAQERDGPVTAEGSGSV